MSETRWKVVRDDSYRPTDAIYQIADALITDRCPKFTLEHFLVLPHNDPDEIRIIEEAAARLNIELQRV